MVESAMTVRSIFKATISDLDLCGECGHVHSDKECAMCRRFDYYCTGLRPHTPHDFPPSDKETIARLLGALENTVQSASFWLDTAVNKDDSPNVTLDKNTYKRLKDYIRQSESIRRTLMLLNNKGE
jgi:hypothetical protein